MAKWDQYVTLNNRGLGLVTLIIVGKNTQKKKKNKKKIYGNLNVGVNPWGHGSFEGEGNVMNC